MVISDECKYVFLELPQTGSTAIAKELCEEYGGRCILRKHSYYHEFLKIAPEKQRKYFVFSGIRNPLDGAVSIYFKLKTNHYNYDDPSRLRKNGGFVTSGITKKFCYIKDNDCDFSQYFKRFYSLQKIYMYPYDNGSLLYHKNLDYVIRFENLQFDFFEVLKLLGITPKRPLPQANKTKEKSKDFAQYFSCDVQYQAKRVFGPFMKKWNYSFPPEWGKVTVPWWNQYHFNLLSNLKYLYWKYFSFNSKIAKFIDNLLV